MNRASARYFWGISFAFVSVQAVLLWLRGGFYMSQHEGDMLHLIDILLRMKAGDVPHLDFMTPLGGWGFQPMVLLMRAGVDLGPAMIWSQILVALLLMPATIWVADSRFSTRTGLILVLGVLALVTALTYGETAAAITLSMHYNRWAWAIGGLVALAVLLEPKAEAAARAPLADALLIGVGMAALAMIKVTYVVFLALPAILVLLMQGRGRLLAWALAVSLAVLALVTLVEGPAYWQAYARDLLSTSGSERKYPGEPYGRILFSPAYSAGTLTALAAMVLLGRRPETRVIARGLVLFLAACTAITWQNYGTDPYWLLLLALVLVALIERGALPEAQRKPAAALALIAATLMAPVVLNVVYSPLRNLLLDGSKYSALDPDRAALRGVWIETRRAQNTLAKREELPLSEHEDWEFQGRWLEHCSYDGSPIPITKAEVVQLANMGLSDGLQPLVADIFSPHWLFSDLKPLPGGAPWTYDGQAGLTAATHLLVPHCPGQPEVRQRVLDAVTDSGRDVALIGETPLFLLYRLD